MAEQSLGGRLARLPPFAAVLTPNPQHFTKYYIPQYVFQKKYVSLHRYE